MRKRVLGAIAGMMVCLRPAVLWAQDAASLVAAGNKFLSAYQFAAALEQYGAIPDTAAPEEALQTFGIRYRSRSSATPRSSTPFAPGRWPTRSAPMIRTSGSCSSR